MRMMERGIAGVMEGLVANVVVERKFRAARPSSATWTVWTPRRRSCCAMTCTELQFFEILAINPPMITHLLIYQIVLRKSHN
jgi:hypothetical protein